MKHTKRTSSLFKLLSSPGRLDIVRMLAQHGVMTSGEIAKAMSLSPSMTSQHLAALKDGHVVTSKQAGKHRQEREYRVQYELFTPAERQVFAMIETGTL